jgi:methionine biosynthesis protein MetW
MGGSDQNERAGGHPVSSPDQNSFGLLAVYPDPARYENQSRDPDDVGMKLASLIRTRDRVLDVGCGTGSVTELIKQQTKADVVGIEPDPARAAIARARGLNVFDGSLSEDILKACGPFDTIMFADVLEHLPNPGELVLLAKKGLVPGGAIVASVPNVAHWFVRLDLLRGRFEYQDCGIMDATHLRWFTRDTLHKFFENLGLRVTNHLYTLNTGMVEYNRCRPWKWFPQAMRYRILRQLLKSYPELFGCQHVVRASLRVNDGDLRNPGIAVTLSSGEIRSQGEGRMAESSTESTKVVEAASRFLGISREIDRVE